MAEFNAVYGLNCTAAFYTVLAFLELLDEGNKRGNYPLKSQVIATASMAGFMRDARYGFAYSSSKAALISLIKCFATYCVPWGIRFNALAAGCEFPCSGGLKKILTWCSISVRHVRSHVDAIPHLQGQGGHRGGGAVSVVHPRRTGGFGRGHCRGPSLPDQPGGGLRQWKCFTRGWGEAGCGASHVLTLPKIMRQRPTKRN